jgi:hypothetical protein
MINPKIAKFGIVLVVVVLVLGALGFRDRKETDVLQLICSVSLIAKTIGILEDEHDEYEDDSSNLEFRLTMSRAPRVLRPVTIPTILWHT